MKKNFGKAIRIFLIDGNPNGRMTCELSNWTGKAYKIPKIEIKNCGDRQDLKNPGVYFLFGKDEEDDDLVYIGEAEDILVRLNQHVSQKDFWTETIAFISKDENLNKAHIKYLEYRLFEIAKAAQRYKILNGNTPTQSSISELDQAEMEEFIDNVKLLVNTLGHRVFDDKPEINSIEKEEILYLETGNGDRACKAFGMQTIEGFLGSKGSKIAEETTFSLQKSIQQKIENLISNRIIKDFVFTENYTFPSPSAAASVVSGRSANGLKEWKTKEGILLKDLK